MYYKIISQKAQGAQGMKAICSMGKVDNMTICFILRHYNNRRLYNVAFNHDDFIRDYQGYIKFSSYDKRREELEPLQAKILNDLKKSYGNNELIYRGRKGSKKVYLKSDSGEMVRFYHDRPAEFLYQRLATTSFADICKHIGNNLLLASTVNIVGEPLDVLENFLPLSEISTVDDQVLENIEKAIESNCLIKDFDIDPSNLGLVVRLDGKGKKRVYVVAFELDLNITLNNEKDFISDLNRKYCEVEPQFLDYDQMVELMPQLADLPASPIIIGQKAVRF